MMLMVSNIRNPHWLMFFAVPLVVLCFAPSAAANSVTFDLNCAISGGIACSNPNGNWGTVTLTDVEDGKVQVTINFTDPDWKLLSFDLNYAGPFADSPVFFLTGIEKPIDVKENGQILKGSGNFGGFDLEAPANGNIGAVGSYTGTLSLRDGSLSVQDFDIANAGNVYFGVHVGGGNTSAVGSVKTQPITTVFVEGLSAIPEPASLLLLGTGLAGLSFVIWRKRR